LTAITAKCQSRPVTSCGRSGSQDLAYFEQFDLLPRRERSLATRWQPTADTLPNELWGVDNIRAVAGGVRPPINRSY
jgi:hypothetical protein